MVRMMVRMIGIALFVSLLALPAMAQSSDDDFPRVEMSFGYANLKLPCCDPVGTATRHSGFASTQGLNLTRVVGIENYFGYYGLGNNTQMIANMFGGKFTARTAHAVPYFVAGIGVGYLTDQQTFGQSSFGTRFGPGVDIKLNDSMALKVDFTRMSFHFGQLTATSTGTWSSGWNFSTGISFALSN